MNPAPLVKRLDIELANLSEEARSAGLYDRLSLVIRSLPNLVTLTMIMPLDWRSHTLLPVIPSSIQQLFWRSPINHGEVDSWVSQVSGVELLNFLDSHPRLESISYPFLFNMADLTNVLKSGSHTSHPSIREWVAQNTNHFVDVLQLAGSNICPKLASRTVTWQALNTGVTMSWLVGGLPFHLPGVRTVSSSAVTTLSLVFGVPNQSWPPKSLADNIHVIADLCPNLREFNLTFTNDAEEVYNSPMQPDIVGLNPAPQVTTISIQRVVKDSELSDPIGTLHHAIRLPWKTLFPGLQAIRIRENVDLSEVMEHPTMAFVRDEGWTIRIEDRSGES